MSDPIYSPSSIIDIYNNSVHIPQERNVISVKGIYSRGTDQLYANQFYDSLSDEMGGAKLTIKTSQLQRNKLFNGKLTTVLGVLNRRIRNDSTIAVSINVTDILAVEEKKISEEDIKRAEIQQKKISIGYKVPETIIKQKLYKNEKPNVALIFATGTVVGAEFQNALGYASDSFNFIRRDVAFTNSSTVLGLINHLSTVSDIIALIRGGGMGAGLDFFNSVAFNEGVIQIKACVISAIGHNEEQLFFKKIADKTIDTPTALGTFFKNIVDEVQSEIANSKAILTEQVKSQFQGQIKLISEQNDKLNTQLKQVIDNNDKLNTQLKQVVETNNKLSEDATKRLKEINDLNIKIANSQNIDIRLSKLQIELDKKSKTLTKAILLVIVLIITLAYVLLN